ncbi:eisosome protein SEG2-like [Camellia sinensis]|uniref:eisosome protein SEG2-like n=1 Tax=Camellia sinensis TaxID=4442 RepID=UPI001035B508|nr:eisosome protein SEG2-like [Camellia sinensis]
MEHFKPLVITNISAKNLRDIRFFGKMKVYAVISITGGPSTGHKSEFRTSVDYERETNPKWKNTRMDFRLHNPSLQNNLLYLNINFYCTRILGDKHVGGVCVSVKRLFDMTSRNGTASQAVRYPVVTSSGEKQGFVDFSFAFGEPIPQRQYGSTSRGTNYRIATTQANDIDDQDNQDNYGSDLSSNDANDIDDQDNQDNYGSDLSSNDANDIDDQDNQDNYGSDLSSNDANDIDDQDNQDNYGGDQSNSNNYRTYKGSNYKVHQNHDYDYRDYQENNYESDQGQQLPR